MWHIIPTRNRAFVTFSNTVSGFLQKNAFRDGEWWRGPSWGRLTLMMLGAILLFFGLFGLLILISPAGVKFFLLLVVIYATIRIVYGFAVDRPFRGNDDGDKFGRMTPYLESKIDF